MASLHGTLPSPPKAESGSASGLPGQRQQRYVKYLYDVVRGQEDPGGFRRGVGATQMNSRPPRLSPIRPRPSHGHVTRNRHYQPSMKSQWGTKPWHTRVGTVIW
jgi:hypothetical protein